MAGHLRQPRQPPLKVTTLQAFRTARANDDEANATRSVACLRCTTSISSFFSRETDAQALLPLFSGVARTASASFSQTTATEAAVVASSPWTGTLLDIRFQLSLSSHQSDLTQALVCTRLAATRWSSNSPAALPPAMILSPSHFSVLVECVWLGKVRLECLALELGFGFSVILAFYAGIRWRWERTKNSRWWEIACRWWWLQCLDFVFSSVFFFFSGGIRGGIWVWSM